MQRRGVAIAKKVAKYTGRSRFIDYSAIKTWRVERTVTISQLAEEFGVGAAIVKRACVTA